MWWWTGAIALADVGTMWEEDFRYVQVSGGPAWNLSEGDPGGVISLSGGWYRPLQGRPALAAGGFVEARGPGVVGGALAAGIEARLGVPIGILLPYAVAEVGVGVLPSITPRGGVGAGAAVGARLFFSTELRAIRADETHGQLSLSVGWAW